MLPDLVEAAQRSGHGEAAATSAGQLARLAAASPGPVLLGFLARARALTAGDEPDAEDHYREAIDQHGQTRGPAPPGPQPPRLRRVAAPRPAAAGRPRAACAPPTSCSSDIGAQGFAEPRPAGAVGGRGDRAGQAAAGTVTTSRPRKPEVARLAAAGATNAEIAAQLYLSPNTVDYHLRKVFRKLGVTSRRQLSHADLDRRVDQ